MKAAALLAKLASKTGVAITEKEFENFISGNVDLPDADTSRLLSGLMTKDDALQNLDVKNHFTYNALTRADDEMNKLMDEKGLSIEDKEALAAEKSTYKRIGQLVNKIQSLEAQKAGATGKDKKELQDKINELTSKIGDVQKSHQEEIKRINSEWQGKLTNSTIRSILAGKQWAHKDIPTDVSVETAMVLLNRELEKNGAKIINSNGGLTLKQAKDESLDWLNAANEKPTFEQFVDRILAESKLLATNNSASPAAPANGQNGSGNYVPPIINGQGNPNVNQDLVNAFRQSRLELEAALPK